MDYKKTMLAAIKDPLVAIPTLQIIIAIAAVINKFQYRFQIKMPIVFAALILLPMLFFMVLRALIVYLDKKFITDKDTKTNTIFVVKYILPIIFMLCASCASMFAYIAFAFSGPY